MSRRRSQAIETNGDSALTWFFVGVLVIAAVAGLLGQITFG
jgi:hypothetical protein